MFCLSITADLLRGHTDTIILAQLIKGDNYGYEINKAIQRISNNTYELKEATLYTAFKRLEQIGYIISYWGDEGTGARRKYYSITETGKITYHQLCKEWQTAKELIDEMIK